MDHNVLNLKDLRLRHYPDPILLQRAEPIEKITPELVELSERMGEIMLESNGIGLAAPQVGVSLRLITVRTEGGEIEVETFINPVLSEFSGWSEIEEGCLSLPGIHAKIKRPAECTLRAYDLAGGEVEIEAGDLLATVFQHEIDHLDGKLLIDRMGPIAKVAARGSIQQLEREFVSG